MPDFDKLHDAARRLELLTRPGQREEGLHSWCLMVGETWKEIFEQWIANPTPEEIRAYCDQFATSIYVRVRLGCEWRDLTVADLRVVDAGEAERVVQRLSERGEMPHRVLVA